MLGLRILGRVIAALWIKWFFVLSFAVPCFTIIAIGLLPIVLPHPAGSFSPWLALAATVIIPPFLLTVLMISWFRTLLCPGAYPTPLRSLRSQPLWPVLRRGLPVFVAAVLAGAVMNFLTPLGLALLPVSISQGLIFILLSPNSYYPLPGIIAGLVFFTFGRNLPGIAAMGKHAERMPIRFAIRHLPLIFLILLGLSIMQMLLSTQLWNLVHIGTVTQSQYAFGLHLPLHYDLTLARVHFVANILTAGLFFLVFLGMLTGYYRAFTLRQTGAE